MKFLIVFAILACSISSLTYTKALREKPWEVDRKESWAASCRKRKTRKNRGVYAATAPKTEAIIEEKSHPIMHPRCARKKTIDASADTCTPASTKKKPVKKTVPVDAPRTRAVTLEEKEAYEQALLDGKTVDTTPRTQTPAAKTQKPLVMHDIAAMQQTPNNQNQRRMITVKNGVTKKMRTYKHWGTSHTPTFTLRANGVEIPAKGQAQVELVNNELQADYHADFYGMRSSADKASFMINPDASEITMTFGWDKEPRIRVDNGTALTQK